ncbi:MAG: hypothetical protein LBJ69_03455 [Holosporales bacterium]|jgi:hypothetical protein|nr:hypothetical protein [Holosporales bacterium]
MKSKLVTSTLILGLIACEAWSSREFSVVSRGGVSVPPRVSTVFEGFTQVRNDIANINETMTTLAAGLSTQIEAIQRAVEDVRRDPWLTPVIADSAAPWITDELVADTILPTGWKDAIARVIRSNILEHRTRMTPGDVRTCWTTSRYRVGTADLACNLALVRSTTKTGEPRVLATMTGRTTGARSFSYALMDYAHPTSEKRDPSASVTEEQLTDIDAKFPAWVGTTGHFNELLIMKRTSIGTLGPGETPADSDRMPNPFQDPSTSYDAYENARTETCWTYTRILSALNNPIAFGDFIAFHYLAPLETEPWFTLPTQ